MTFKPYVLLTLLLCQTAFGQIDLLQVDSIVRSHHDHQGFEGVILVATKGQPIYHQAFGYAHRGPDRLTQPDDIFRVASITKKFTAIRILQLYAEGHLGLNSTVASFLPDFAVPNADNITIRDLLMHTSGLPMEEGSDFTTYDTAEDMTRAALKRTGRSGEYGSFRYNNIDYLLLGFIIESITEQSWQENIAQQIIEPLGMTNTGFLPDPEIDNWEVTGYIYGEDDQILAAPDYHIGNFQAAGCMYSTTADLLKLDQALYTDVLLDQHLIDLMYDSDSKLGYVGLGSWAYNYPFLPSQPRIIERRGGLPGFNHVFLRAPEAEMTMIILSNNNLFDPDTFGQPNTLKEALMMAILKE